MTFKTGDKIKIIDGSWSVKLSGEPYDVDNGVNGSSGITGIIRAIDCRLPIGPDCMNERVSPIEGMPLAKDGVVMFNDLLVQTENSYICTATRHVKLVKPQAYKLIFYDYGVEINVTPEQYEALKGRGFFNEQHQTVHVAIREG